MIATVSQLLRFKQKRVLSLIISMSTLRKDGKWPLAAVCQMTAGSSKADNLQVCRELILKAASKGAEMVFLPEAFDYIAENKDESLRMCESLDGTTILQLRALSKQCQVWLSLGGFHQKDPSGALDRLRNSHVIIDRNGDIADVYDKIHLFDVDLQLKDKVVKLQESAHTLAGNRIAPPVRTPIGKVGLGVCYDLRFPEMSLALRNCGSEILTYPSAFTANTGKAHWEVLLRSRAIESQCYVIAAAQVGQHNSKRSSYGHAMIVDPWGTVVASCGDDTDIAFAEIDLDYLEKVRREMPVNAHRRLDLFGSIATFGNTAQNLNDCFMFGPIRIKPSQIFLRTCCSVAFVNIKPVLAGHVLVASLHPAVRLADLSPLEVGNLFCCVQQTQRLVEYHYNTSSSTIAIQDGPEAGQTVPHVHVHVIPRRPGDFNRNDDIYDKLEKHDKTVDVNRRTDEAMAAEAEMLRTCLPAVLR